MEKKKRREAGDMEKTGKGKQGYRYSGNRGTYQGVQGRGRPEEIVVRKKEAKIPGRSDGHKKEGDRKDSKVQVGVGINRMQVLDGRGGAKVQEVREKQGIVTARNQETFLSKLY